MITETKFLEKIAEFTNIALGEIQDLELELHEARKKVAAEQFMLSDKKAKFSVALEKAANALYDTDFLTDDVEKKRFFKMAKEDPSYLANMLEKVCKAADVSLIGIPARVASKTNKSAEYDPVAARAFGYGSSSSLLDD